MRTTARTTSQRPGRPRLRTRVVTTVVTAALLGGPFAPGLAPAGAQEDAVTYGAAAVQRSAEAAAMPNTVSAFGDAPAHGPTTPMALAQPLAGIAAKPGGDGYWLVASDGGIFTYGDARFLGSTGALRLNKPIVGMAPTASGEGYWLVASDGGIFAFGDARFFGSTGGMRLNQPIVGMAAEPDGEGYWLVARDGGIFSFGTAGFHGSMGATKLNQPIVSMASTRSGDGYWFVAADGGIFTFGDARFFGSTGGRELPAPVVSMAADPGGEGYWLAAADGRVHTFGVDDHGSAVSDSGQSGAVTVGIAADPTGGGYWLAHGAVPVPPPSPEPAPANPAPANPAPANPGTVDLAPGVAALQQRLTDLGYWLGPVDGTYGNLTQQAVYAFQKVNDLAVDGKVGPATRAALARASRPVPRGSGDGIEIDKSRQVIFIVRGGRVVWAYNTSTGTEKPYTYEGRQYLADTPPGRWRITRQIDGVRVGNLGRLYRPKYFHPDGIAVHGSSFVPPYPDSHGCARVTDAAIDQIWGSNLAPIGSAVWVYGTSPTR